MWRTRLGRRGTDLLIFLDADTVDRAGVARNKQGIVDVQLSLSQFFPGFRLYRHRFVQGGTIVGEQNGGRFPCQGFHSCFHGGAVLAHYGNRIPFFQVTGGISTAIWPSRDSTAKAPCSAMVSATAVPSWA